MEVPGTVAPQAAIMQMLSGKVTTRALTLAAEFGLADLLRDGPRPVSELANATDSNEEALYRMLRTLSAIGVFAELSGRRFQNTPVSEALRSDAPGSLRAYARWIGQPLHWDVWTNFEHTIRTGRPSLTRDHPGKAPFEILAAHPDAQAVFNEAMAGLSMADGRLITAVYDFSSCRRIVDVGGGHGTLARLIAQAAPEATVTVFDQPHVVASAAGNDAPTQPGSVAFVAGSFFDGVPGPSDLCVLKHILHDWPDPEAVRILANCRAALAEGGRVLVAEMLVSDGPESIPAKFLDLEMMAGPGGRERSVDEFDRLFRSAGFRLARVIETPGPLRLLEAI